MAPHKNLQSILQPIEHYLAAVDEAIQKNLYTGVSLLDDSSMHTFKKSSKKIRSKKIKITEITYSIGRTIQMEQYQFLKILLILPVLLK